LSFGIQDFDPEVQEIINRIQPVEMVRKVVEQARAIGFNSINFDLIYGLPKQTSESVENTLKEVNKMKPERIAFYSYAHVPWIKGIQRKFTEDDLPKGEEKRQLYELGKSLFEQAGYAEIGMDHFALPSDSLYEAMENGTLHRNFMGYTTTTTELMVGLGVSSISDSWTAFAQNYKTIRQYEKALDAGEFPIFRGHLLNDEDQIIRRHILNLMCRMETNWDPSDTRNKYLNEALGELKEMENDRLLNLSNEGSIVVHENGRPFVRNVCMSIDARLARKQPEKRIFSQTI
jgi:oxygen-independent coproporphyrinogen-3 oxidase